MTARLDELFPDSPKAVVETARRFEEALVDIWCSSNRSDASPATAGGLCAEVPARGRELAEIIGELRRDILPACLKTVQPGCVAHMDTLPTLASAVADAITASLNNNMLFAELSPAFTVMEQELLRWFAGRFGLPEGAGGTMISGGSLANLLAVLVARHQFDPASQETGWSHGDRAVVVASDTIHTSIPKALMALGMGRRALVEVPSDDLGRIRLDALDDTLGSVPREGKGVVMVVAVAGTTVTGVVDDLEAVGRVCQRHGVWFHVDAAYGGAVAFSRTHRELLRGINLADSITFNPQKWLYVPKACAMLLLRRPGRLPEAVGIRMPYADQTASNFGDLSLQGTRPVDALKLWLNLQLLGLDGIEGLIDHTMSLGRHFADCVERSERFSLFSRGDLNICCFTPADASSDLQSIRQRFYAEHQCRLSLPMFRGRHLLRAVLLNPRLTTGRIDHWFSS